MNKSIFYCLLICCLRTVCWSQSDPQKWEIRDIRIEGNDKTKERYITRELSFGSGESYTQNELDSMFVWDENRIYNTNLFNSVDFEISQVNKDLVDVFIKVEERWYLYPFPIFRLIDRNFNDWWVNRNRDLSRVNYGVKISQYNFRGRGELLRVIFQSGFTTLLNLQYNIPYIDRKQRHGLFVDMSYFEAKNVAYTTSENVPRFTTDQETDLRRVFRNLVRHSYRSSFYSYHNTFLGHLHVTIADTLAELNPNYLGDGRTLQRQFFFGYSYVWDKRNNINYPTEGERLSVGLFKHGLGIHQDGVDYWRARLKASKYWDLKKNFFAASDVSVLTTLPETRDYYNYYKIGLLLEVLRGYDLNVVEGSSYVIQRNEIKHRLFQNKYNLGKAMPVRQFRQFPITIYGKIYFDQGYVKGYPNYTGSDLLADRYLYSYGTGLDLVIVNDITFRFEYTRNALDETYFFINFLSLL